MAVLKSTTNSKASGRNIVEEPKPAIVPIISAISAEIKNNIVSASIFFNSIESLYKYHYVSVLQPVHFHMYLRKSANSQVLIEKGPTSFPLTADKIKVLAEVVFDRSASAFRRLFYFMPTLVIVVLVVLIVTVVLSYPPSYCRFEEISDLFP